MNRVKLGVWNIHGLSKKLKDEDVNNYVNNLDFAAFVETWTTVRSSINVSGYGSIHQFRKKRKRRGRPNGGILLLYQAKYKHFIEQLPSEHEDVLIVKVKGEALGHTRDLVILTVYVKPSAAESSDCMFEIIEKDSINDAVAHHGLP